MLNLSKNQCNKNNPLHFIQSWNKWAVLYPTAREKAEMKAAQTALLICLWEDEIYEEGSQVWEVKTQPPESLMIWGSLELVLGEPQ